MNDIPQIKRHPLIEQLAKDMAGLRTTFDVEALGYKFTFQLLEPEGEDWAVMNTPATNVLAFAVTQKKVRFAASLVAINGTKVTELYPVPEEEKNWPPAAQRTARRTRILEDADSLIDGNVLRMFDEAYTKLDVERKKRFSPPEPANGGDPPGFARTNPSGA